MNCLHTDMNFDLDEELKTLPMPGSNKGFIPADDRFLHILLLISYLCVHLFVVLWAWWILPSIYRHEIWLGGDQGFHAQAQAWEWWRLNSCYIKEKENCQWGTSCHTIEETSQTLDTSIKVIPSPKPKEDSSSSVKSECKGSPLLNFRFSHLGLLWDGDTQVFGNAHSCQDDYLVKCWRCRKGFGNLYPEDKFPPILLFFV